MFTRLGILSRLEVQGFYFFKVDLQCLGGGVFGLEYKVLGFGV